MLSRWKRQQAAITPPLSDSSPLSSTGNPSTKQESMGHFQKPQ